MQQVLSLLKKMEMLASQEQQGAIDIDLMLDYSRTIYGLLLEQREGNTIVKVEPTIPIAEETDIPEMPLTLPETNEITEEVPEDVAEVATVSDRIIAEEVTANTNTFDDRDIRKHIGINDKYLFISELFENDKEAYERALNEINRCTFCREATDWLTQQVKGRYNWDHEDDTVQQFYGIVSNFFASR